jgi:hypothetical protein
MNDLEFIEKEIRELKFQINYIKSNMKKYIDFRTDGQLEIDMKQLKINHLQQIKSKIEAWEVMKKHLTITLNGGIKEIIVTGIDYEGQKNSLFIYSKEGVPIIEKALEVEE